MTPEDRRVQLLASARSVFGERGYHRTGVAEIVAHARVARGTIYRHFESKRDAFSAVVTEVMAEVVGVVRPIDVNQPIGPQVRANLERLVHAIADEQVVRLLFTEASGIDDEGDAALRAFYRDALARIEAALHTGQRLGVVGDGDVHLLARCLLGLIKEPVVQASLHGEPLRAQPLVQALTGLLERGVLR